jgi:hypothetical protein
VLALRRGAAAAWASRAGRCVGNDGRADWGWGRGVADRGDVRGVEPWAVGSVLAVQARHDDPRVHARRRDPSRIPLVAV